MMTSLFIPARFGKGDDLLPVGAGEQAAVPSVSAEAAPELTMAASHETSVAIRSPTRSWSSSSIT